MKTILTDFLTSLREDLIRLRVQNTENQKFFDILRFRELLTKENTHRALRECGFLPHQCRRLTASIREEAYRIFALLLYLDNPQLIEFFLQHKIHAIPVREEQLSKLSVELGEPFTARLLDEQLAFKPHFFHREDFDRIDASAVLPIVRKKELDENEGTFGAISEIVIHPSFHDFFDIKLEPEQPLIRKRIKRQKKSSNGSEKERVFEKERTCLELLGEIRNTNIVPLFYSYTFQDEHYLVFPRISMDLSEFLRQETRFGKFSDTTTFYTALQGLASALDNVHHLTLTDEFDGSTFSRIGYHHDLRPANVLVTLETFLLADFGLSKFIDPDERKSQTEWKCGRGDYIAPECYGEGFAHGEVGRAIDIWALGCMVIDIATYMENGLAGLKNFRTARIGPFKPRVKNGYFFHDDRLKEQVSEQMRDLQTRPENGALWSLVHAAKEMLTISPSARSKASEVYSNFTHACTVALFADCMSAMCKFIEYAHECKAIHFLASINFELIRLMAWGDVLGLSSNNLDPQKFSQSLRAEDEEAMGRRKQVQDILVGLKDAFRDAVTRMETMESTIEAISAKDMEKELRDVTAKRLNLLFDGVPLGLRKVADSKAQEYFNTYTVPKAPSTRPPGLEMRQTEDDLPLLPRPQWYIWDAQAEKQIPTRLAPSSQLHSPAGRRTQSVLECLGFDPRKSAKAMHPGAPIHHILQPPEKFRVV